MENLTKYRELALKASCGDNAGADFLVMMLECLHVWDDLIDKDKTVSDEQINELFFKLMVWLPLNPFYQKFAAQLSAVMLTAIQNWRVATDAERGKNMLSREVSFAIRSSYVDVVTLVATLCGGITHGKETCLAIRSMAHSEGMDGYLTNLEQEFRLREGA